MSRITVSDRAIAQIVEYSAGKCDGFGGMSDKSRVADAARKLSKNTSGVYVIKTKSGIKLDIYIACTHGANAKALAENVRAEVMNAFPCTGIAVGEVIVHINDVR